MACTFLYKKNYFLDQETCLNEIAAFPHTLITCSLKLSLKPMSIPVNLSVSSNEIKYTAYLKYRGKVMSMFSTSWPVALNLSGLACIWLKCNQSVSVLLYTLKQFLKHYGLDGNMKRYYHLHNYVSLTFQWSKTCH